MQENGKIAHYEPDTFRFHGLKLINIDHTNNGSIREELKKIRANFGTTPLVCNILWRKICPKAVGVRPQHLLWTLNFLKLYNPQHSSAQMMKTTGKTYMK